MKIFCKKYQKKFAELKNSCNFATETKNKSTMNTTLNHRVTIYVPSTYEGNKPARRMARKATAHTARVFSALFGGATATKAAGYWVSDTKGLIKETQTLVFSACTEADKEKHTARVIDTARALCRWMKQEAVTVEIDGTLQFVTAE